MCAIAGESKEPWKRRGKSLASLGRRPIRAQECVSEIGSRWRSQSWHGRLPLWLAVAAEKLHLCRAGCDQAPAACNETAGAERVTCRRQREP
jgi:hypothetical protein